MDYSYAIEKHDFSRIDKLNKITDTVLFFSSVERLCKSVTSCHSIRRWECLAEIRYKELLKAKGEIKNDK